MDEMRTPEGTAALATHDQPRHSAPSALAFGDLREVAEAIGRKNRLQSSDGAWSCWGCGAEMAEFHVTLHCEWCLQEHEKNKGKRKHERRMEQLNSWKQVAGTFAAHAVPDEETWERG